MTLFRLDYGNNLYDHDAAAALKALGATIHHSAVPFITTDSYCSHHCELYAKAGWKSMTIRGHQHTYVFICEALLSKLPRY